MKRSIVLAIVAAALLFVVGGAGAFADDISLTLIPSSGAVFGPPGSTVGWGYIITNDTSNWLVTLSLSADVFQNGTPYSFFDFPVLAPDTSATVDFVAGVSGLYQLTWDTTAPSGFVNSGTFVVSSDYYNGDPTMGGTDIGPAPDLTAAYSGSGGSAEPPAALLLCSGLVLFWGLKRTRRSASRCQH
jgi:hypothetical protein